MDELFRGAAVPGKYVWRALVAPARAGEGAPDEAAAYELRAVVPLPYRLTLKARFEPKRRTALAQGTLTGGGGPRAGVDIWVLPLPDRGAGSITVSDAPTARTKRDGTFTIRMPLKATSRLFAIAFPVPRPCGALPAAAAGCLSETTSPAVAGPVRVRVPAARKR